MTNKTHYIIIVLLIYISVASSLNLWKKDYLPKDLGQWQAVFLSDGQVYFGHLEKYNRSFVRLSNVHYLKYGINLAEEKNLNLIKLGGEVHGPENAMYISRDKILFIENLSGRSPVVSAMKK